MIKKSAALMLALLLVASTATACGPDKEASQSRPTNKWEEMPEEQLLQEIQKMKDEGILDENGQPAPGVDLNDYPGLG